MKIRKKSLVFIGIILLAGCLRLWKLGVIPSGISNDEAGYIYSSYSLWKTGHDVAGKFLPLSVNLDNSFSPVYIYLDAPFVGLLGLSPFTGRLPYTIIGILTVIVIYYLTELLVHNVRVSLLTSFVMAVSPWHLQLSRAALDAPVALFFFLLAIFLFIKNAHKGNILWSAPAFILAFYSYHATKVFWVLLIPLLLYLYRRNLVKRKIETAFFLLTVLITLVSFIIVVKTQQVTRQQVFIWNDTSVASRIVDRERTVNSAPKILRPVFNNKVLYYLRIFRENYIESFSPEFLFLYGDPSGLITQYGLLFRGMQYFVELPLLLFGLYWYIKEKANRAVILFLLLAPVPSMFNIDKSYANRSVMMLPFLVLLVGYGINKLLALISRQKNWRNTIFVLCVSIYGFFILSYLYQYYYRYSLYGAESWMRSSRDISTFIRTEHTKYDKVQIANAEQMFLLQYAIYNRIEPQDVQLAWKNFPKSRFGNIDFNYTCTRVGDPHTFLSEKTLLIVPENCYTDSTPNATINEIGEVLQRVWKVYKKTGIGQAEPEVLNIGNSYLNYR